MAMSMHISLGWADVHTCDHGLHTQIKTKFIPHAFMPIVVEAVSLEHHFS